MDEQEVVVVPVNMGQSRERGEIGQGTPGLTMKRRHRAEGKGLSLQAFARKLAKDGDETAKRWFENKKGMHDQKRSDANIKAAIEAANATKLAKKPKAGK